MITAVRYHNRLYDPDSSQMTAALIPYGQYRSVQCWAFLRIYSTLLYSTLLHVLMIPFSNRNSVGALAALAKPIWNLRLSVISAHLEQDINLQIIKENVNRRHSQRYPAAIISSTLTDTLKRAETDQCNTTMCPTIELDSARHSTTQYNTTQHNTTRYSTVQHSIIKHDTTQYSTTQ